MGLTSILVVPWDQQAPRLIIGFNEHSGFDRYMYAYVAGENIRIDNVPLVPTFKPNVLSHGKLKESGVDIRLDAYPPYMTIKGVKIILAAYKYVYYFIAYPVHEAPDYEEALLRHLDTLGEPESDDAPFSVHEPYAIWTLWASAPANMRYKSL